MQNFSGYPVNTTNNDANQYLDINMLKFLLENNSNVVIQQNGNTADTSYVQQNKPGNQYLINLPIHQQYMVQMQPYANVLYLNNQHQFANNDAALQCNAQLLPMQLTPGVMQVDLNKSTQQSPSTHPRSRKRSGNAQQNLETVVIDNSNEDVPRDTRNRPLLYSCPDCTRKFSMQSRLNQHIKCHNGIRPFICGSCNFAFTQKSYLVRHAAVHKEERPYVCELCQKTYKHYGSLANHRKTHKNSTPCNKPSDNENNILMDNIDNCKTESQIIDIDSSFVNSFVSNGNSEYHFQNQQEIQQLTEADQSYSTQITPNLFHNSFQDQFSTDANTSYTNQLNSQNENFYELIKTTVNSNDDINMGMSKFPNQLSDINNNSSISIECSSQPVNLT